MNETNIVQEIRMEASKRGARLFRNNVGGYKDKTGRWVKYGLGDGTSDLIGITPVVITHDMVGTTLGVFTAIEVKTPEGMNPKGKVAKEHFQKQQEFVDFVVKFGGIGKIICNKEDL
jgi:hypothetical protein